MNTTKFNNVLPELGQDEFRQLEQNILANGIREPLVVWVDYLVDGHNRYTIANKHKLPFKTVEYDFKDDSDVIYWIVKNNIGRRNLNAAQRAALVLQYKPVIAEKAKEKQREAGGDKVSSEARALSPNLAKALESIDTREELAKIAGVSHGNIAKVEKVINQAPAEVKDKMLSGELSVNQAYANVRQAERKTEAVEKLENIEAQKAKAVKGVYDVIVLDPPWSMQKIERDERPNQVKLDYPTMSEEELAGLKIPAADDCHIFCWTTHKFLPMAFRLLEKWGFKYVCTFVWHKPGGFQPFGLPQFNCEFCLYAHKGSPQFIDFKNFFTCFSADRTTHSEKPEAFYETLRRVTAGRRLDMFNRREIADFDGWGNESV